MAEAVEAKTLTGAADMDKYQTQASETGEAQEEPGVPLQASFEPPLDWDNGWGTDQDDSPESSDGEWTEEEGSGGRLPTVRMAEPDDRFIGNVLSLKGVQDQLARSAAAEKEKCTT